MSEPLLNWAGNLRYSADKVYQPTELSQVQEIVRDSRKVRPLGTRHCFNTIADSTNSLVSMEGLNRVISLDEESRTVKVESGIRYGDLEKWLYPHGFTLKNLASLPHISVAGACATATHGSGVRNGNLATHVSAIQYVLPNGELREFTREAGGDFDGAIVALGALGPAATVTLDVVPTFAVAQSVYEDLPFDALKDGFFEIMSCAYSVSLFTSWNSEVINQIWVKSTSSDSAKLERFGARAANRKRSPIPDGDPEHCTEQLGQPGPSYDRLPHFRLGFTPSSGAELQTEYFVPIEFAWAALSEIHAMQDKIAPLLFTTEVRTIDSDQLWMSPNFKRKSVAIHFTWKQDWEKVSAILPEIEARLSAFGARPHWGKIFRMSGETVKSLYSERDRFCDLVNQVDPGGKFRNEFVDQYLL